MNNIEQLLKQIIPPDTREDRDDFSNEKILSELDQKELEAVEKRLIEMLPKNGDYLIADTLVHLNSEKSIPELYKQLEKTSSSFEKIKWASFINEIRNGDEEMEVIAFNESNKMKFIYEIDGIVFCDLVKFKSDRINKQIEKFVDHKYFLVAHYAKLVLNYEGYTGSDHQRNVTKRWWEFWK